MSQSLGLFCLALAPLLLPLGACQGRATGESARGLGGGGAEGDPSGGLGPGGSGDGSKASGSGASGGNGACLDDESCTCSQGEFWDAVDERCRAESGCGHDEGLFEGTGECFACSPALSCEGLGETGILLATTEEEGATCVCQTRPGYFPGSEGSIAEECDADGDGWVNDRAQPSVESANLVIRENARCKVRRIRSFFLENEAGQTFDTAAEEPSLDLTVLFPGRGHVPPGLPLFESSRNDADPDSELPIYGSLSSGRRLAPAEVNSLTKACVGITVDTNHNGITDVSEWSGHEITRSFSNQALESYYERYTEFGYFLALHDGYWEASGESGVYRIVERPRTGGAAASGYRVPLEYPDSAPSHARECKRHPDTLFPWSSDELSAPNTIGADFARFSGADMLHHSQFKCVQVTTKAGYGGATAASAPELVYLKGDQVVRKEGDTVASHKWTLNDCAAGASTSVGPGVNAVIAEITCVPRTSPPEDGSVSWAAVHYEHYTTGYTSPQAPGGYLRGCANECADEGAAPNECWGCTEDSWGEPVTKSKGAPCGEGESCDGAGQCSGCLGGLTQCKNAMVQQVCSDDRAWVDNVTCQHGCYQQSGTCYPECAPGAKQCSGAGVPQTCSGLGTWSNGEACAGETKCMGGSCLLDDGKACSSSGQCFSGLCKAYFQDADQDGYGSSTVVSYCGSTPPLGASTNDDDCCDADFDAKPSQNGYFSDATECGGHDYNCDGNAQKQSPNMHACNCTGVDPGWLMSVPDCGGAGKYGICVSTSGTDCHPIAPGNMTQRCR